MNYEKIYKNLYEKAKSRKLESERIERHHFIPRSLYETKGKEILESILGIKIDGVNDRKNVIALTCEEHYTAHLLLYKIFQNSECIECYEKMKFALQMMFNRGKGNKNYKIFKEKFYDSDTPIGLSKGTLWVHDKREEKKKRITTTEYYNDTEERYKTNSRGKTCVENLETGKIESIDCQEYEKYKDIKYRSLSSGKLVVFDKVEKKNKRVKVEEYFSNKERYFRFGGGCYYNFESQKNETVSKEEYERNKSKYGDEEGGGC
jgi:hypothetical protein